MFIKEFRHRGGVGFVRQHANLHGGDLHVRGERFELFAQRGRRRRMNRGHALRGLHRQRRHRGHAVAVVRGEGFQIGGYSRAAGGIEPGNRKQDWWMRIYVIHQLFVPSAQGTIAGVAICARQPNQNVRALLFAAQV